MLTRKTLLAAALLSGCLLAPPVGSVAYASDKRADRAAAEALFNRALLLMKAGDYAGACPQLEESQKLDPAVGTLLYLGDCYEQQSKVASAWAAFNEAADAARGARQPGRERMARQRADALAPKLPKIIIAVHDEARLPGLEVKRNGVTIGDGAWGVPVPVDAGRYEVQASAPGRATWSTHLTLLPTGVTRTIRIPLLEPVPIQSDAPTASPVPKPDPEPDEGVSRGDGMRIAGAVVGGTGLVGIVLGIVYGVQAKSKESDSESFCQPPDYVVCTQPGLDLLDESSTASTVANVSFVAGGVLVATGLVLVLAAPSGPDSDPRSPASETAWSLAARFGPSWAGITARTGW